jgi:outer membrane protein OmpA-like peptidoglycan-associated protein
MTSDNFGLSIHGHTDDIGSTEYNQQLSEHRARAVKDYIVSAGIDPDIIAIRGYGKSSPLAKGRDDASRAKNRRVEIALTDSSIRYKGEVIND